MKLWQTEPNAVWYTDERLFCDLCKKQVKSIVEIKTLDYLRLCNSIDGCFLENYHRLFAGYEYLEEREIIDVLYHKRKEVRKSERRKMTPKLRYLILKRDNFKCVLCGATAKGTKLHIDHIKPISNDGKTIKSNLRTLCQTCNLGKSKDE